MLNKNVFVCLKTSNDWHDLAFS